jgi:hypothetical protein
MNLSKEERALKNAERNKLIEQRELQKKLEIQREIDRNTVHIVMNTARFTQLCKMGFFVTNTPTGRFDIPIYSADILTLCNNKPVDKEVYDKIYRFIITGISNEDLIEIVKRSTMFSELATKI